MLDCGSVLESRLFAPRSRERMRPSGGNLPC
jgi:hypothetical protein